MSTKTEAVTFYAVDLNGKLKTRMGRISWKFGKAYRDPVHNLVEYTDGNLDMQFEDGMFTTDNPDQIAYLDAYSTGGKIQLSGRTDLVNVPQESQLFRITRQDPLEAGVKVVTEVKEVNVNVIPKALFAMMDLDMKVKFCKDENIELPGEVTMASVDRVIKESGRIK
jgi:hypothetical protein